MFNKKDLKVLRDEILLSFQRDEWVLTDSFGDGKFFEFSRGPITIDTASKSYGLMVYRVKAEDISIPESYPLFWPARKSFYAKLQDLANLRFQNSSFTQPKIKTAEEIIESLQEDVID